MQKWKICAAVSATLIFSATANAACPAGTTSKGQFNGKELCALQKRYLSADLVLTSNNHYLLSEGIFVGGDNSQQSSLRIEAGTTVYANPAAFLSVSRGSKLIAEGALVNDRTSVDRAARVILRGTLDYPAEARNRGVTGEVFLRVLVGTGGAVEDVQITRAEPPGIFEEAAQRAVRSWKFEPAFVKGKTVVSWVSQKIRFEMN